MKLYLPITNPIAVPPNSAAIVIRVVQTSGGGSGVGTVFDFAGTTHPSWGLVPMVLGPIAVPALIPAGTTARFKDTTSAPPSATNWSIKIRNPVPGTGLRHLLQREAAQRVGGFRLLSGASSGSEPSVVRNPHASAPVPESGTGADACVPRATSP